MGGKKYLYLFLFILLALLVYGNAVSNGFVFDDIPLIVKNHQIKSLHNIPELLGFTGKRPYYRPLRMVFYTIEYHFFKLNSAGYHLINIAFHILTSWLVFLITLHLTENYNIASAAALLFVVHPVHTDSVTYISGQRDIFSTFFYLFGFFLFIKYRKRPLFYYLPLIITVYVFALACKEMAVTLPALFFLYDFIENIQLTKDKKKTPAVKKLFMSIQQVWRKYPCFYLVFFIGAILFTYYKVVIAPPSHRHTYYGGAVWTNFFTVARILVYYIKLLLFPVVLNADYSFNAFPVTTTILDLSAWCSLMVLIVLFWLCFRALYSHRIIAFSLLWFFTTLVPVCHLFPHHELLAEHYLYLPSIGIFLLAGIFFHYLRQRYSNALYTGLLCMVVVLFGVRTIDRNGDWKNALTLWEKTVKTAPQCARALNNLGVEYYRSGEVDRAEQSYLRALTINPVYPDPYHNLGNIMADRNCYREAIQYYKKAFKLCQKPAGKEILNSWGVACKNMGDLRMAKFLFFSAITYDPYYAEAHNNMATVLYAQGDYPKALEEIKMALSVQPLSAEAHNNLGNIYRKTGKLKEAVDEFQKALQLKPDFMEAYNNIGIVLKAQGRYKEAIEKFSKAIELHPESAEVYTNLGNTYRKAGQTDKAIDTLNRALQLNPRLALAHLNLAIIYLSEKKDAARALFHLKKTVEIDPSIPQAGAVNKKIAELEKGR